MRSAAVAYAEYINNEVAGVPYADELAAAINHLQAVAEGLRTTAQITRRTLDPGRAADE